MIEVSAACCVRAVILSDDGLWWTLNIPGPRKHKRMRNNRGDATKYGGISDRKYLRTYEYDNLVQKKAQGSHHHVMVGRNVTTRAGEVNEVP